jgi:hypothetical protein
MKMNFENLEEGDADVREPQSKEEVKTNTRKIKQDKGILKQDGLVQETRV